MANSNSTDDLLKLPDWLVRLCKNLWSKRSLVWGTIILGLILNCIASLGFTDPATFNNLPIHFLFRYWWLFLLIGIVLWICTVFVGLIARLGAPSSGSDVKRSYLKRIALDTRLLTLKGIPAGLIAESVNIDEVFIPLQLRPNRPRTDYPLTDKELALYQQSIASGMYPKGLDKVVLEAEQNWQHVLKRTDKISIADMWNRLSDEEPAAVIQGYPGMGKSTLMERLTLHMALRGLQQQDPDMPEQDHFVRPLIPILLRLGKYAKERKETVALSLSAYIARVYDDLKLPDATATAPFIQKDLAYGACLV